MPIQKISGKTKGGKQAYRVRLNFTAPDGTYKRLERTVYGLAEARDAERALSQTVSQTPVPSGPATLRELVEAYNSYHVHEVRASTHAKASSILRLHILSWEPDLPLSRLNAAAALRWRQAMNEKPLSVRTRNGAYAAFRAVLNYGRKLGLLSSNPISDMGPFRDPNLAPPREALHFYTPEQFRRYAQAMLSWADTDNRRSVYVFFCAAFYTGCRKGELNALRWSDLQDGCLTVRASVAQKVKTPDGSDTETPPKNLSSFRTLQIPAPLLELLSAHKRRQQSDPRWNEQYLVFGGTRALRDTTLDHANRTAAALAGLPHIRVHDFRHSHASLLINEGINIQEIARRLGHSDVKMTWNTYGHLYPREAERALQVLDRIPLPKAPEKITEKITENSPKK